MGVLAGVVVCEDNGTQANSGLCHSLPSPTLVFSGVTMVARIVVRG